MPVLPTGSTSLAHFFGLISMTHKSNDPDVSYSIKVSSGTLAAAGIKYQRPGDVIQCNCYDEVKHNLPLL